MAIETDHHINWKSEMSERREDMVIPHNRVIKFNYSDFKKDRRALVRSRINTLLEKIIMCPFMRMGYIQEINRLIIIERGRCRE